MQPGILHHYFKDRDEIIEEMVRTIVDEVSAKYLEEIQRYQDPEKRFEKAISFLFGPGMINDEYADFFSDCWAEARRNPRIRESFKMLYERFCGGITTLLVQSGKASALSSKQIEEVAGMIVAIQDGVSLQWVVDSENVRLRHMATITKQMVELYLDHAADSGREKAKAPKRTH